MVQTTARLGIGNGKVNVGRGESGGLRRGGRCRMDFVSPLSRSSARLCPPRVVPAAQGRSEPLPNRANSHRPTAQAVRSGSDPPNGPPRTPGISDAFLRRISHWSHHGLVRQPAFPAGPAFPVCGEQMPEWRSGARSVAGPARQRGASARCAQQSPGSAQRRRPRSRLCRDRGRPRPGT